MSAVLTQIERGVAMEKDLSISNFTEIVNIIETAKNNAYKKVNEELIKMYWKIGGYLHNKSSNAEFGDAYVDAISEEIVRNFPGIKGFSRRGLYRMKQLYELYENDEFVSALLTQISWTNHLAIMSKAKKVEERHFYIALCAKEQYSSRELERQIESGYYERYMLSKEKLLPETIEKLQINPFLDTYVMEFLDLPDKFLERDLRKGLIRNMKSFILEVGKDFTFIDEEYKVMVGNSDFFIDLLFYHRGLQCLVAFELKVGKFKPEYISKMDFYLEALDRQIKKENENPSVGLILCASKDDEVVEYAMSRSMSPMMVAEYKLQLAWLFLKDKPVKGLDEKLIKGKAKVNEYIRHRPNDEVIEFFTNECEAYWSALIGECQDAFKKDVGIGKYRNRDGGHVFFRPVSLIPFTKALVRIKEKENLDYENLIRKFPSSVFWIQNDIWKKIIWDDVKKSMIMGNSKLIELIFLYSYDNSFLTESEKKKIVKELESKWDYHESDIIEIFEQRLLGENI